MSDEPQKPQRVWKPLDVGGLRLYQVILTWPSQWGDGKGRQQYVVAAKTPLDAVARVRKCYEGCDPEPLLLGRALNILMPAHWWENGVPDVGDDGWGKG